MDKLVVIFKFEGSEVKENLLKIEKILRERNEKECESLGQIISNLYGENYYLIDKPIVLSKNDNFEDLCVQMSDEGYDNVWKDIYKSIMKNKLERFISDLNIILWKCTIDYCRK